MAGQEASGVDGQRLEALAKRLGDLERQANEVTEAFQRSASVRRILTLSIVAVLGVFLFLVYRTANAFMGEKNLDELMFQLNLRATANSDEVFKELQTLVDHTQPTVVEALNAQFQKDMPAILDKLGGERENLAVNLQDRLETRLQDQFNKALDQHRAILKAEFKIEDDETLSLMIHHFEGGFQPLVKQYYGEKLRAEFERMYRIWDDFPQDNSKRTRAELEGELYSQLMGLLLQKVSTAGAETPASGPSSGSE